MDVCGTCPRGFIARNNRTPTKPIWPTGSNARHRAEENHLHSAATATVGQSGNCPPNDGSHEPTEKQLAQRGSPAPGCLVVSGSLDCSVCVFRAVFGTGLRLFRRVNVACSPTGSPGALAVALPTEDEREMGDGVGNEQEASRNTGWGVVGDRTKGGECAFLQAVRSVLVSGRW